MGARPAWSTACPDWGKRLRAGRSIIPPPIFASEAERALAIFKELRVVDLPGRPTFGECADQWVFDFVAAVFGAYDSETGQQLIREFYLLISKKNTKSTIAAGIMLTALILCWREEEEHLILAPTVEVAGNSFKPAAAMVRADDELLAMFHVQDHVRTITHRVTRNSLKVVAAESETVSGKKSGKVLVDEHWLFGKRAGAEAMFLEALGGQVSRDEGWVIFLTTQSDEAPAGVFKEKLDYFRSVRDGKISDPRSLGVLYEFPEKLQTDVAQGWRDPKHWHLVTPNLGKSISLPRLVQDCNTAAATSEEELRAWASQHLNIQIGLALRADRWAGADFWEQQADRTITLDALLERCEVAVVGIDGGGLDDLLGLAVIGREIETRRWLVWTHAWAHEIVLQRRKDIAPRLQDFKAAGDLTVVKRPGDDVQEVADIVCRVREAGLLPEKLAIGVDAAGIGDIFDELTSPERGFTEEQITAISQGWRLNSAIKTAERKLAGGEMFNTGSALMNWCTGNAKVEPKGNAITITKQASGNAKIDPLMAVFDAVELMARNPAGAGRSFWEEEAEAVA